MSNARPPLQKIVILGDGQTGLMAAIALAQAVPSAQIEIITAGSGFRGFADLACTALPFTNRFHDRFGFSEDMMVGEAGGTHRLAVIYSGWSAAGTLASMSYGLQSATRFKAGIAAMGLDWSLQDTRSVMDLGEVLAKSGRFAPPPPSDKGLAGLDYALRWNRQLYGHGLVTRASALEIKHRNSTVADVRLDDTGVVQLVLTDGTTLSADLWLDCSGHDAILASRLPEYARIDWSTRLPIRRIAIAQINRGQLALADQLALTPVGWVAQTFGPDGKEAILGLAEGRGDDDARRLFGTDDLNLFDMSPGRIDRAWQNNVIALGDCAMQIEPLAWTNLDFAHRMIDLLLEFLPGREIHPLERQEFNRRFALMAEANCDFVASHYAAPLAEQLFGRLDQSDGLATSLQQFRKRGKTPFIEEAALDADQWQSILRALGIPAGSATASRSLDVTLLQAEISAHQHMVAAVAERLPPYESWVRSVLNQSADPDTF